VQVTFTVELGMRGLLNKQEALDVLHEIYETCKESVTLSCVSLDAKQVKPLGVGYQIRMKGELDFSSRQLIQTILGKRGLAMKEENGYVLIFPC
jgi:hypothetical protein